MDHLLTGLVNYCVPTGEAYQKALQLAREINQKVRLTYANISLLPGADPQIWLGVGKKSWTRMASDGHWIKFGPMYSQSRSIRVKIFCVLDKQECWSSPHESWSGWDSYNWVFDQIQFDAIWFDAHRIRVTRISMPSRLTQVRKKNCLPLGYTGFAPACLPVSLNS